MEQALCRDLEFSQNTKFSGQELLFEKTKPIISKQGHYSIPQSFYKLGYTVLEGLPSVTHASHTLSSFISSIDIRRLPLFSCFVNKIQLAKLDMIPVCADIIPRKFQALHFDMGQPIVSPSTQTMYVILALYKPIDSEISLAETRMVSIEKLLSQKKFGSKTIIGRRLTTYVKKHGDGWKQPTMVNTFRLSCFARILDAVTNRNELIDDIDNTTGQWFDYSSEANSLINEQSFYFQCGLDLTQVEARVALKPGQLLIIDNMRCVHGRFGPRKSQEVYQFLFGVKSATPQMIDTYREWLVRQFSTD